MIMAFLTFEQSTVESNRFANNCLQRMDLHTIKPQDVFAIIEPVL